MREPALVLSALAIVAATGGPAQAETPSARCAAPMALTAIEAVLPHAASRVERHEKLTIVAIGSSSTQGVGASSPALSYPSRLEAELKDRYPKEEIRVVNRGKGGEDVAEELARLRAEVIAEHPDLVIWQLGTNAVLRRDDLATDGEMIRRGVDLLKGTGADVVLMDLQYAPRVLQRAGYAEMERLIANAAKEERIGLFRRFEIMQHWQAARPDAPAAIGPDGLHMNDLGYRCLAAELAESLAANWRAHQRSIERREPAAVAGLSAAAPHSGTPAAH